MRLQCIRLLLLSLLAGAAACESFLDEKPDKQLIVPSSLAELQALLDNYINVNFNQPSAGEISAGDYYLADTDWAALPMEEDRRMYLWEPAGVFRPGYNDWSASYSSVYVANTVLGQLDGVSRTTANAVQWDDLRGQALFLRANQFLQNALVWAPAYDPATAAGDLGIPLRLGPDFAAPSARASVRETYDRILLDLQEAARLLPARAVHPLRGSRAAAYALLARTSLAMGHYEKAGLYADSSLQLHGALLDYNTLDARATYPVPRFNPEVLAEFGISSIVGTLYITRARVAPDLYGQYAEGDLRRGVFFRANADGSHSFKGSYTGDNGGLFGGPATDEVYLMRAEAYARQGKVAEALADLNYLLVHRWQAEAFVPLSATSPEEALALILTERRKELLMRGLRWMDLKRLNREGAGITLTRSVGGKTYTLPPNDARYALPLPEDIVALSGMQQNPR